MRKSQVGTVDDEHVELHAELTDNGVRLVLLDIGLDTSTSEGRLMVGILSALAQQELETIQERTRVGLEHARAQGRVGGRPPKLSPAQRAAALAALRGGLSVAEVATPCIEVKNFCSTPVRPVLVSDIEASSAVAWAPYAAASLLSEVAVCSWFSR